MTLLKKASAPVRGCGNGPVDRSQSDLFPVCLNMEILEERARAVAAPPVEGEGEDGILHLL